MLTNKIKVMIFGIAAILTLVSIYLALIYAPTHETMGDVQRIFYIHVASAWVAYLAFGVTFVAGLMYLISKDLKWDIICGIRTLLSASRRGSHLLARKGAAFGRTFLEARERF